MAAMQERIISKAEYREAEDLKNDYFKLPSEARRKFRDMLKVGLLISELYQSNAQAN